MQTLKEHSEEHYHFETIMNTFGIFFKSSKLQVFYVFKNVSSWLCKRYIEKDCILSF